MARKVSPNEIITKINFNAYRLKVPSIIRTYIIFNVMLLITYHGYHSDEEDLILRTNIVKPEEKDVDSMAEEYIELQSNEKIIH